MTVRMTEQTYNTRKNCGGHQRHAAAGAHEEAGKTATRRFPWFDILQTPAHMTARRSDRCRTHGALTSPAAGEDDEAEWYTYRQGAGERYRRTSVAASDAQTETLSRSCGETCHVMKCAQTIEDAQSFVRYGCNRTRAHETRARAVPSTQACNAQDRLLSCVMTKATHAQRSSWLGEERAEPRVMKRTHTIKLAILSTMHKLTRLPCIREKMHGNSCRIFRVS